MKKNLFCYLLLASAIFGFSQVEASSEEDDELSVVPGNGDSFVSRWSSCKARRPTLLLTDLGDGYHDIGGHVYYFSNETLIPWVQATKWCNGIGMTLPSIETQQEHNMLAAFLVQNDLVGRYWTSGYHVDNVKWLWTANGRLFTHTQWFPTEPNLDNEPCVAVSFGALGWYDDECTQFHFLMCE